MATTYAETVSEALLSQWREQGYVLLKQAIPRDEAAAFLAAADEVIAAYEPARPGASTDGSYIIARDRAHRRSGRAHRPSRHLPDHRRADEPLPAAPGHPDIVRLAGRRSDFRWHTDAGPSLQRIRVTADSLPLNFKVQFFLTDIAHRDRANFCLVPGSHRQEYPESGVPAGSDPPGAVQLVVEAGDVAIFPYNLWHSVAPSLGDSVRRSVTFRYGQMWCRPFDYEQAPQEVLARLSLRRRRLLGDMGPDYTPSTTTSPTTSSS